MEYLVAAAGFLNGEVTRDNPTKERVRRIIEDEVCGRGRGVSHHAAGVEAGRVVRVRQDADRLGRAVQVDGRTRGHRQVASRVEGIITGIEDDLTRIHREPVTCSIEILLGAELQRTRQGLRGIVCITQHTLDVEGGVGVDSEVEVIGGVRTRNDQVGTNDIGDRATCRSARDEDAAVRERERTKAKSVNRDRGRRIDQDARRRTSEEARISSRRVARSRETNHIGRRTGDAGGVDVGILILDITRARADGRRGELVSGRGQDRRDGRAFRDTGAVNGHADREAEGGTNGDNGAARDRGRGDRGVVIGLEGLDTASVRPRGVTGGVVGRVIDAVRVDDDRHAARCKQAVNEAGGRGEEHAV